MSSSVNINKNCKFQKLFVFLLFYRALYCYGKSSVVEVSRSHRLEFFENKTKDEKLIKMQTYMKAEICKLYSRIS